MGSQAQPAGLARSRMPVCPNPIQAYPLCPVQRGCYCFASDARPGHSGRSGSPAGFSVIREAAPLTLALAITHSRAISHGARELIKQGER